MHERYRIAAITRIWSDVNKLKLWQLSEPAVLQALVVLGQLSPADYETIERVLKANPPNIKWWKAKDAEIHHDLNAFLEERLRHMPKHLQLWFHRRMTSYDTEESTFVRMLLQSVAVLDGRINKLMEVLKSKAHLFRFTPMMGDTHGQWADVMTHGKRNADWYCDLRSDVSMLDAAKGNLRFSKMSGFVGNNAGMDPQVELIALERLGFKPYHGATQIMPRELYVPLASSMVQMAKTLEKIALTIRLGARSGTVIYQEPFGRKQKGSSAGPQKRNPIRNEKVSGLANMIEGYMGMIVRNCQTWEERDIAQSCVERNAWPDIFHALIHAFDEMIRILSGLVVYPDNMLIEIVKTNGCYAASVAKEDLKEEGVRFGLEAEDCYRMVQLAAFNLGYKVDRGTIPTSYEQADTLLLVRQNRPLEPALRGNIRDVIREGRLQVCEQLDISRETIDRWNRILVEMFESAEFNGKWNKTFSLSYLLRNEPAMFDGIFGEGWFEQAA